MNAEKTRIEMIITPAIGVPGDWAISIAATFDGVTSIYRGVKTGPKPDAAIAAALSEMASQTGLLTLTDNRAKFDLKFHKEELKEENSFSDGGKIFVPDAIDFFVGEPVIVAVRDEPYMDLYNKVGIVENVGTDYITVGVTDGTRHTSITSRRFNFLKVHHYENLETVF